MSTATEKKAEVPSLVDASDELTGVRDKLAALEAASRAVDSARAGEGMSRILEELRDEVEGAIEAIEAVCAELPSEELRYGLQRSSSLPGLGNHELLKAFGLAVQAIALASDGELVHANRSAQAIFKELFQLIDPVFKEAVRSCGLDFEDFERPLLDRVNAISEGEAAT